jgi:LysW-gamma-L-alpha-aminoadipyl-6-phosphate/LysW-L-glutamyl-5-phosphate reductase
MSETISVSVAGASGYTGMEAIRILHGHPKVKLTRLYGSKSAGSAFSSQYRGMEGLVDLPILPFEELASDDSGAIFLGLPHGKSAETAKTLFDAGYKGRIVDMSSDFRLRDPAAYEKWYGWTHPHPELIGRFVYGLTEWYRNDIRMADHISNPGCFASAIQLGLLPFAKAGLVTSCDVTGITGSSGSGASPSAGTHFSSRFGNVKAYKVYGHQHIGEVNQTLAAQLGIPLPGTDAAGTGRSGAQAGPTSASQTLPEVRFVPVSGPFVRGIWMTLTFSLAEEIHAGNLLEEEYYNAPLVRLQEGLPELKQVVGSAFTDIGWVQQGRHVVIGVAIDNLLKGAASQAVQNLNLMMDWPEETGLTFPPSIL